MTHNLCTCEHGYEAHDDNGACTAEKCPCYSYEQAYTLVVNLNARVTEANLAKIIEALDTNLVRDFYLKGG